MKILPTELRVKKIQRSKLQKQLNKTCFYFPYGNKSCVYSRGSFRRFGLNPILLKFSWEILDKFGILHLPLLFTTLLFTLYFSSISPFYCLLVCEWQTVKTLIRRRILLRSVCLNTQSKYGKFIKSNPLRNFPGSALYRLNKLTCPFALYIKYSLGYNHCTLEMAERKYCIPCETEES